MRYNRRAAHVQGGPNSPLYHAPAILSRGISHKVVVLFFPYFVYFDYCNPVPYLLYYNCSKGEGGASHLKGKIKFFKKLKKRS